jgi:uncharacterized protein
VPLELSKLTFSFLRAAVLSDHGVIPIARDATFARSCGRISHQPFQELLSGATKVKIVISGASGLVGKALSDNLRAEGHTVAHLVRSTGHIAPGDIRWTPTSANIDVPALEGADAVVHLSGANVAEGRWTQARKQVLRSSRVDSTRLLVDSISRLRQKPRVFVCASAIGYYGNRGDEILTESSHQGKDFLSFVARDWEGEAARAEHSGIRAVMLRFGVILAAQGGALPQMLGPFKRGFGGKLGNGKQWMSWIALEDTIRIIRSAIGDADQGNSPYRGPVNVVSPNPIQNADFTQVLASVLGHSAHFRVPAFALRIALGEMANALLLSSQRVRPESLLSTGYAFRHENLEPALRAILKA